MATKKPTKKQVKKPAPPKKAPVKKAPVKKAPVKKPPVEEVEEIPEEELPTHPPEPEEAPTDTDLPPITDSEVPAPPTEEEPEEKLDKEKLLSFIEDIIDVLSFKRVGLVALLVVIGIILYSVYENRAAILGQVTGPRVTPQDQIVTDWALSNPSKASLQALARTTDVSYVAIVEVDLKLNRRVVTYYYIDDPEIRPSQNALTALGLPQVLFDYDAKNTAQMVSVLSNEFRCDPYTDTVLFRYAPELAEKLPTVCRIAIPPFVGQFVGFISIATGKPMTRAELESIRLEMSRLAVEIYFNDVIKRPESIPAS